MKKHVLYHFSEHFEPGWTYRYGFLFAGYEPKYAYWEIVVLVRKAAFVLTTVFTRPAGMAAQVMAAMQTHAHFCLSEVHSGLSQDGDALAHRKHLHSLDQLHGDVNTLGEIFAKRAVCELHAVDVRPSSLLDDSDDDDDEEEEEEGEVATVLE